MPDPQKKNQVIIPAERLKTFIAKIFEAKGCSPKEAGDVALYLLDGNLTGHDSHGVIRTPRYVSWVDEGRIVPGQSMSVVSDSGTILVIEGNFGFGQTIAPQALRLGMERAKKHHLAVLAIRNSGHMGRIGTWAEMAAAEGLVYLSFVNVRSSTLVAPFGGVDRRISTAPFTAGVPTGGDPIILDFATSAVAEGKALVALRGGKALPPDVLISPDGKRSNDPALLYGDVAPGKVPSPMDGPGALRGMGEHKGSGLAFLMEILAGALTGAGCAGPTPRRYANNMLAILIDPKAIQNEDTFLAEVRSYIDYIKSSRPEEKDGKVLIPGDPERLMRADRSVNGVPLSPAAWDNLTECARKSGVSEADIAHATAG